MKYKLNITARDLKLGCRGVTTDCPIARAMARVIPGSNHWIDIYYGGFVINAKSKSFKHDLANIIAKIDAGKAIKPFKCIIEVI